MSGHGRYACGADTELRKTWRLEGRNGGCFRILKLFGLKDLFSLTQKKVDLGTTGTLRRSIPHIYRGSRRVGNLADEFHCWSAKLIEGNESQPFKDNSLSGSHSFSYSGAGLWNS